jgi:two-component SAPR family response regulator
MTEIQSRFLLVDDDDPTNVFHKYILEKAISNSKVSVVSSGQFALDWLNDSKNSTPDIIFLDINMPLMSGWEFLQQLQQFQLDNIPGQIVIFQSHTPTSDQMTIINNLNAEITFHKKPLTLEWVTHNIKTSN